MNKPSKSNLNIVCKKQFKMGTSGSGCMFTQSIASKSRNVKRARTKIKIKKLIKINVKTYTYKPSEFQLHAINGVDCRHVLSFI